MFFNFNIIFINYDLISIFTTQPNHSILKLTSYILLTILLTTCSDKYQQDIVFENFENQNFQNWKIGGISFNNPIDIDSVQVTSYSQKNNFIAYSNFQVEGITQNKGKLTSKQFTIVRDYIKFDFAGGNNKNRACINLIVNNKIVRTQTGNNDLSLRNYSWDVHELKNKKAYIEIVDGIDLNYKNNEIGYVAVDNISFTNSIKDKDRWIFEDFETGNFSNWKKEGDAFQTPQSRANSNFPMSVNGYEGQFFACSFTNNQDASKGKLSSQTFTIKHDYLEFKIAGGNHPYKTGVLLKINGKTIKQATGKNSENMRTVKWELKELKGEKAQLIIIDTISEGWGNIMVDQFVFYNQKSNLFLYILSLLLLLGVSVVYLKTKKPKIQLTPDFLKINQTIIEQKLYLNKKATLKSVASSLELKPNQLNSIIEKATNENFYKYINKLRVEEFIKTVNSEKNNLLTINYIAENCGFGSKASFYRIFKEVTGKSPKEYRE